MTYALNVERVKKEEYKRKERDMIRKTPLVKSYQHHSKKFKGPQGSNPPTAQATSSKTILPAPSVTSAPGGFSRD